MAMIDEDEMDARPLGGGAGAGGAEDDDEDDRPGGGGGMAGGADGSSSDDDEGDDFWDDPDLSEDSAERARTMKVTGTFECEVVSIKREKGVKETDKSKRIAVYFKALETGQLASMKFWLKSTNGQADRKQLKSWVDTATKRFGVTAVGEGCEDTWENAKGQRFRCKIAKQRGPGDFYTATFA
jgi:hypothetical protein